VLFRSHSGRLDQTLVVICSDHGEHLGEKQLIGHSISLYNELVQVPLIICDPSGSFPADTERSDVVSTRCLFHTILSAAGLANEMEEILSLAQSPKSTGSVFSEAIPPQNVLSLLQKRQPELVKTHACDQLRRAVWIGNHKLIETGSRLELYDFCNDPDEMLNLSDIFPENVELLQDCLQGFADQNLGDLTSDRAPGFDDPEVQRRLRDLGYLED